jgi:hypothetical protein
VGVLHRRLVGHLGETEPGLERRRLDLWNYMM